MNKEYTVYVEGKPYKAVISDNQEELLKAYEAGKTVIGLWNREDAGQSLYPAEFIVESCRDIDSEYLKRAVRRRLGLPWIMGETSRLLIREFTVSDIPEMEPSPSDTRQDKVFYSEGQLLAYISNQYGFYQYGIWALIEKDSNRLIGKAGITQADVNPEALIGVAKDKGERLELEIGYHIFTPYRRNGYAREACRWILDYAKDHLKASVYAKIDASNEASIKLADELYFTCITQRYNEGAKCCCLYGWNC